MFNTGSWKQKAGLMALGSVFTIIGMLFAFGMLPSVTAQRDKFGDIECTKLTLIDALTGKTTAKLETDEHGGLLYLYGANDNRGGAKLTVDLHGGKLIMFSNEKVGDAHVSAMLRTSEEGTGSCAVWHKNGAWTSISATENGGYVSIYGSNPKKLLASIGVTDDGESGLISVRRYDYGKEIGAAQLKTDENGGRLDVFGKVDGKSRAAVSINEYGNGVMATWDKNGYRQ